MAGTGAPPPAWYPDPGRRHEFRWWDGVRWTEHVSNRRVISRDPLPPRPPARGGAVPGAASGPPRGAPATPGPGGPGPGAPGPAAPGAGTFGPGGSGLGASGPAGPGAVPGVAPGTLAGLAPGEQPWFEPGAWLEAYSVFLRRSPGGDRGVAMSFDVRDAGGTALLSVVSVPALSAANAPRRRAGAVGSDLLLVTPADVPVARLARSGPADQYVLLLPAGGVLGWAAVAPDADPLSRGGLGVGLTLGTEAAAPPWARLRMLGADAGEGEITTTTGLLVATTTIEAPEPSGRKRDLPVEHRLSYRTDITPTERLLTVTALIALDLAAPLAR